MLDLTDSIVMITGASAGIGAACASAFAGAGSRIIVAARRLERLEAVAAELYTDGASDVLTVELDVRDADAVQRAIAELPEEWREIDILVNNAGLSRGLDPLWEGSIDDWEEMIDTNVKGLLYVTRAVLPGMVERDRGHIINIGSIAGREVYPRGNVYCASKHAVRALTRGMQIDVLGTHVRVSSVDPGLVETEFSTVRFRGDEQRAAATYQGMTPLTGDDVAEAVLFCATRPPHVNVHELLLMPEAQATSTLVRRDGQ